MEHFLTREFTLRMLWQVSTCPPKSASSGRRRGATMHSDCPEDTPRPPQAAGSGNRFYFSRYGNCDAVKELFEFFHSE